MKRKVTIFALFYFVFKGKFQVHAMGTYIRSGDLTEGSFYVTIFFGGGGGAYIWRGLFSEFYGSQEQKKITFYVHFSGQHAMRDKYHG